MRSARPIPPTFVIPFVVPRHATISTLSSRSVPRRPFISTPRCVASEPTIADGAHVTTNLPTDGPAPALSVFQTLEDVQQVAQLAAEFDLRDFRVVHEGVEVAITREGGRGFDENGNLIPIPTMAPATPMTMPMGEDAQQFMMGDNAVEEEYEDDDGESVQMQETDDGASSMTSTGPTDPDSIADTDFVVTSNRVGFFLSGAKNKPPLINVGDRVAYNQPVCIIEQLGQQYVYLSEAAGTVVKVLIEDGEAVEFGTDIMVIRPD